MAPGRRKRDRETRARRPGSLAAARADDRPSRRSASAPARDAAFVRELEDYGLVEAVERTATSGYPERDVEIVAACARLSRYGVEPRNLRQLRHERRQRGGPARADRRAGAALAQPRAPPAPGSRTSRRWPRSRRSSRSSSSGARSASLVAAGSWRPIDLESKIRDVPDFPKPGIVFKDIMPLLADPEALREAVERPGRVRRAAQARSRPRRRGARLHPRRRARLPARLRLRRGAQARASSRGGRSSAKYALEYGVDSPRAARGRDRRRARACSSTTTCSRRAAPRARRSTWSSSSAARSSAWRS